MVRFAVHPGVRVCDFLETYDIWFRPIYAFFIVSLGTREVVRVAVTRSPTNTWTAQQLRNVTPFGEGPRFIIRDRDNKFGPDFHRAAKGAGIRVIRTAVRAPLVNSVWERFLGSVRRECLDHLVILNERHLQRVLEEYTLSYFNRMRPHQGTKQRVPVHSDRKGYSTNANVESLPVLARLHYEYRVAV